MHDTDKHLAVVTGAGRGLGSALAFVLAQVGCDLILCGRSLSSLQAVSDTIRQRFGTEVHVQHLDLSSTASVAAAVAAITARGDAVDILVNNGAMWLEYRHEGYSAVDVATVIGSAVTGTYLLTQGLMPLLERSRCPDIVTIGSTSGLPNAPIGKTSIPFYAAKRAQAALADGLRQTLAGTPVRSIVVHPPDLDDVSPLDKAWDDSEHRAKGQAATNRDIADAVLFALSRPRHVTLSITVDTDDLKQ